MGKETSNVLRIEAGKTLFCKGEQVNKIALLIKGTVKVVGNYIEYVMQSGTILGLIDARSDAYMFEYVAMEEAVVFLMDFEDYSDLSILEDRIKNYSELSQVSCELAAKEIIQAYRGLLTINEEITELIFKKYTEYKEICNSYLVQPVSLKALDSFFTDPMEDETQKEIIHYVESLSHLKTDTHREFFESGNEILFYHLKMISDLTSDLNNKCEKLLTEFNNSFNLLYSKGQDNLFAIYSKLAFTILDKGGDISEISNNMDEIVTLITKSKDFIEEVLGLEFQYDYQRIHDIYETIQSKKQNETQNIDENMLLEYSKDTITDIESAAKDTLHRIFQYIDYDINKEMAFKKYLTVYRTIIHNASWSDDERKLIRTINDVFYDVYEKVFIKAEEENNQDPMIQVFLDYGCMDERMLQQSTIVDLYSLNSKEEDPQDDNMQKPSIYTIRQWLHAIYTGKRDPSKNEYDLDYSEYIRESFKKGQITEKEKNDALVNRKQKVHYEICNMLKINNRLTSGKRSSFCPVLCDEDFIKSPRNLKVLKKNVEECLNSILKIDSSAFVREILYEDIENNIPKVNIYRNVLPDIILMPNVGEKGIMWQEITGKKRESRARFLLPAFTNESIQDMLIYIIGAFRWELCRTIQGIYWNDVTDKSLTSEYYDYMQFYKKNRDLSEEVKEKIKSRLAKSRNSIKEVFAYDYSMWINHEAYGLARLNKVSRLIMFQYCPFSKSIREKISGHPMFEEGIAKFEREKRKRLKELKNRYSISKNENGVLPKVLEDNLNYVMEQ